MDLVEALRRIDEAEIESRRKVADVVARARAHGRVSLVTGWRGMRASTKDAPVSRMSRSSPSSIEVSACQPSRP